MNIATPVFSFVKRFPYWTVVLSVTLVYCGQLGRIKVELGTQVGLSPGHIVLDGDSAPLHPIFGPCLLWPNGRMDQDATLCGGKCRPRRRCVRWSRSSKGAQQPVFSSCVLWPDGCMGEDATWNVSRPQHNRPPPPPSFQPMSIMATIVHLSYCWALVMFLNAVL